MSDYQYEFNMVPKEASAHAARRAVLYPLCKPPDGLSTEAMEEWCWQEAGPKLLKQWRARLVVLKEAGWNKLAGWKNMQYARNCWPGGMLGLCAYEPSQTRTCQHPDLCPWCWARRTIRVFKQVYQSVRVLAKN